MRLKNSYIVITLLALVFSPAIICAVNGYQWSSHGFDPNPISLKKISHQADVSEGSAIITLDVNTTEGATITADHGPNAQLHSTRTNDTLVTEYKLSFDRNGSNGTGGSNTEYESYDTFLTTPAVIIYYGSDNDVVVTLWVRASNTGGKLADSGSYSARQTLTVSWIDP